MDDITKMKIKIDKGIGIANLILDILLGLLIFSIIFGIGFTFGYYSR